MAATPNPVPKRALSTHPFNSRLSCLNRNAFWLIRDSATDNPDPSMCIRFRCWEQEPKADTLSPLREPSTAAPRPNLLVPLGNGLD